MFIAASILLMAVGLVIWTLLSMAQSEEDLRAFSRFEMSEAAHPGRAG